MKEFAPRKEKKADREPAASRKDRSQVKDMCLQLWDKKLLIVLFVVVVSAAAALMTAKQTKLYRATTRLEIENKTVNLFGGSESVLAVDTSTIDYYNTQFTKMKSPSVLRMVIDELGLKVTDKNGVQRSMHPGELGRKVKVEPVRETRLVDVSVHDGDPKRAGDIANMLADKFIEFNISSRVKAKNAVVQAIKKELGKLALEVEDAERRFSQFKAANDIASLDEKQSLRSRSLTAATERASRLKQEKEDAQAAYNAVKDLSLEELKKQPAVADYEVIQKLRGELKTAQRQVESLSGRYGEKHPLMIGQRATVKKIQEQIDTEAEAIRERLRNALLTANEKEVAALQELTKVRKEFHEFDELSVKYRKLEMEVQTAKRTYEDLLSRSSESEAETALTRAPTQFEPGTSDIQVIDTAVTPGRPFKPKPVLNMAVAIMIGLALGIGSAFVIVHMDDSVKNPDDITEHLQRKLLAEIRIDRRRSLSEKERGTIVYWQSHSKICEDFRTLRTSVELMASDGRFPSVLVTSAWPG